MGDGTRGTDRRGIGRGTRPSQGAPGLALIGVTYDAGALVAADKNDRRMWALHAGFLAEGVAPVVPAPVLAQAWRGGGRQASLVRFLALCEVEAMSADQARNVGVLAAAAGPDDVVDLAVVEGAARRGDAVITADARHLSGIVRAAHLQVHIEPS